MSYRSFTEVFQSRWAATFWAALDGRSGHNDSYYAPLTRSFVRSAENPFSRESSLCFDISNQYIQASVDVEGTIQEVRSAKSGLIPYHGPMRGVYVQKDLVDGGPWRFEIIHADHTPVTKSSQSTGLLDNLLPLTEWTNSSPAGEIICRQLAFAPISQKALPVVIIVLHLTNPGLQVFHGLISYPVEFSQPVNGQFRLNPSGQAGIFCFEPRFASGDWPITIEPGKELTTAAAFIVAASLQELSQAQAMLGGKKALQWLNETLAFHRLRLGELRIADPYYADALVRMEELCRQAELYRPDGSFAGGTLGSNVNPDPEAWWNQWVWMKDNFYAALPMALFQPEICEKAISFFLEWGVPERTRGRGMERYPSADPVTNSVSNALSGIVLAGAYYRSTGNRAFFLQHPFFLKRAREILERVLKTQFSTEICLFPSMYISDGDARGDFHTGTNLIAWFAFQGMARLCHEVYEEQSEATRYRQIADRIRRDLLAFCTGDGILGCQYFEGAFADRSFVVCHDGEESDVALMPFYGWTDADDPALIHYAKLALTPFNPLYSSAVDGIAWFDEGYASKSTFPGFTSAIAGSVSESDLITALERIRRLTDLDGSIWWWPHRLESASPAEVSRFPQKCCWAAAVYVLKFVNDILGIQLDQPARQISLRPFIPWDRFEWRNCCLGNSRFDFAYQKSVDTHQGSITNRTDGTYTARIDLTLPAGSQADSIELNEELYSMDQVRFTMRYQRPCYRVVKTLLPNETLRLKIGFHPSTQ